MTKLNDASPEEWDHVWTNTYGIPVNLSDPDPAVVEQIMARRDQIRKVSQKEKELKGVKYDNGKLRLDLVPPEMEEALAEGLTAGIKKGYPENNWAEGLVFSRSVAAAKRHLNAWRKREDIDEETGVNHIKLAALNLLMVAYQQDHGRTDLDDRITK